jgi:hypothetical protein
MSKAKKQAAANVDAAMAQLASLLLQSAAASLHVNDLAAKLRCSAIAIYKWLNGAPISPAYAFLLVVKLRHRLDSIANKRQLEQARKLLADCKADLDAQI